MEIEGLTSTTTKRGDALERSFFPEGRRGYRRISLKVAGAGIAAAELIEGRERPGIENGEFVPIVGYTEEIGDRVVRAMAKIHFNLDEATTGYTEVDADMISRGFNIGAASGSRPVWSAENGPHFVVVSKTVEGGLPSTAREPATLVFGVPDGHKVTVFAESLEAALRMLDTGQLPRLLKPTCDVEVHGARYTETSTYH